MSQMETEITAIPSPCIGVCTLRDDNICVGCGRTVQEITRWPNADEAKRREIAGLSSQRLAQLKRK